MKTAMMCMLALAGCGSPARFESVSRAGETLSHNPGSNCASCHNPQGTARSWFTASGTLLLQDGTVRTSGNVVLAGEKGSTHRLEVDGLGNFFTTEDLGLPDELVIPQVFNSQSGKTTTMPFSTPSADCNFCHSGSNHLVLK